MKYLKEKYLLLLANKLLEKITNPRNAKEHYQSFIRNKNTNSIITEYPKTSYKLSQAITQAEKVGPNSPLYSNTKKVKIL